MASTAPSIPPSYPEESCGRHVDRHEQRQGEPWLQPCLPLHCPILRKAVDRLRKKFFPTKLPSHDRQPGALPFRLFRIMTVLAKAASWSCERLNGENKLLLSEARLSRTSCPGSSTAWTCSRASGAYPAALWRRATRRCRVTSFSRPAMCLACIGVYDHL